MYIDSDSSQKLYSRKRKKKIVQLRFCCWQTVATRIVFKTFLPLPSCCVFFGLLFPFPLPVQNDQFVGLQSFGESTGGYIDCDAECVCVCVWCDHVSLSVIRYNTNGMVTQLDEQLDTDSGIIRSHGNAGTSLTTTVPEAAQNRTIGEWIPFCCLASPAGTCWLSFPLVCTESPAFAFILPSLCPDG